MSTLDVGVGGFGSLEMGEDREYTRRDRRFEEVLALQPWQATFVWLDFARDRPDGSEEGRPANRTG